MSVTTRPVQDSRSSRSRRFNWLRDGWTAPAGSVPRTPEDRFNVIQAGAMGAGLR